MVSLHAAVIAGLAVGTTAIVLIGFSIAFYRDPTTFHTQTPIDPNPNINNYSELPLPKRPYTWVAIVIGQCSDGPWYDEWYSSADFRTNQTIESELAAVKEHYAGQGVEIFAMKYEPSHSDRCEGCDCGRQKYLLVDQADALRIEQELVENVTFHHFDIVNRWLDPHT